MADKAKPTNQEIDGLIATIKKSNLWDSGEKYEAIEMLEARRPKTEEPKLATREEIDAVFGHLDPTYKPAPKPESAKTEHEKEIDKLLDKIMPWS